MNSKIIAFADLEDKLLLVDEENIIYEINKSDLKVAKVELALGDVKTVKVPKMKVVGNIHEE